MTTVRPEVVALLTDIDMDITVPPHQWTHLDGRPVTPEEAELAGSAVREELEAVQHMAETQADFHQSQLDDASRLDELLMPQWSRMPGALLGEVLDALPENERAEAKQILDRMAPDGTMYVPGSQ